MNKLNVIGSILGLALISPFTLAAGTTAGTTISNQATVTYDAGAGQVTATSASVNITVQELINATMQNQQVGDLAVSVNETGTVLKYTLTNTGNGAEAFKIVASNITGDQFDVNFTNVYVDDGDNNFNAADTLLVGGVTPSIAANGNITIWVLADIPATNTAGGAIIDGNKADVIITAQSKTFLDATPAKASPNQGDVVNNAGDAGTDAVFGATGNISDDATYVISAIQVSIAKTIEAIRDNLASNSNKPVPGADVDYQLLITVIGTGSANNVVVTDPLPSSLALKNGINGVINVNGVDLTASSADADNASYDANTNTITVNLGTVAAGAAATPILFTTVIQ